MKVLRKFYAVTLTSLYEVEVLGKKIPVLEKLALRGESSIPVGGKFIGEDKILSIGRQLILFIPEGGGYIGSFERKIEQVNTRYWGAQTSPIIALFLKKNEAEKCFKSENQQECDTRWVKETKEVLKAIGEEHPAFSICHWPEMELVHEVKE